MQTIVGTRAHDDIVRLIDSAERIVVLISPFIEVWPGLRRAVARAVSRGVHLTVITRGPRGPSEEDMAVFYELDAEILEVPGLHLKAYLSEKAALTGGNVAFFGARGAKAAAGPGAFVKGARDGRVPEHARRLRRPTA